MNKKPPFLPFLSHEWVNDRLASLTLKQKIAQLLHVATWSNRDEAHYHQISTLIEEYGIGGLTFFQGDPETQAKLTNRYQAISDIPLMISIDAEWGLAMRLDHTVRFPYQMALGAIEDDSLIYDMGREIGRHCRRIGIHVNFAPVVDINTHPDNPVIGFRSFGADRNLVTRKAEAYMQGMQDEGILAVAKHFPGHGDTHQDSHFSLPLLPHDRKRLDETELFPYYQLIPRGLGGIMTAHLHVPELDNTPDMAASLSRKITHDLLIEQMGFEGVIFTDALDMKGVAAFRGPAEVNLEAFRAGNDVMLFCTDVPGAQQLMYEEVNRGEISEEELDHRCRKLLAAKYWMGLANKNDIPIPGIQNDLHTPEAERINLAISRGSITVEESAEFPPEGNIAALAIFALKEGSEPSALAHHGFHRQHESEKTELPFHQHLHHHLGAEVFSVGHSPTLSEQNEILVQLESFDHIIISLHDLQVKAVHGFGITEPIRQLVEQISKQNHASLVIFGSAYIASRFSFPGIRIIHAYQETEYSQLAAGEFISGKLSPSGKLPV